MLRRVSIINFIPEPSNSNNMNIIFICHGNICRSVAAEYIAKHLDEEHKHNYISRATSYEEIGNDIYPPMKQTLRQMGIPFDIHHATRINHIVTMILNLDQF